MITLTFTLKEAKGLMDGLVKVQDALESEFNCGSDIIEDLVAMLYDKMEEEMEKLSGGR